MSTDEYHRMQSDCDDLCNVTVRMVEDDLNLMKCVTCPFCKETVNAILTEETISCPKCKVTVKR